LRVKDLHILPKFSDGWSYLYVEHCRVDQEAKAIAIHDTTGKVPVPCANLALLMLGPGVSITHAAVSVLADHGCLVAWCGEEGVRFYAVGMGETRNAVNFLHQAKLWANETLRMKVVRSLYQTRFSEKIDPVLSIQQIRGMEGVRVRESYAKASRETGIPWKGRSYKRDQWINADPVNRALSAANSCLYGVCQAAIVSAGFSTALGFIHTGKMLSFVYDIADLYKTEVTIPIAFRAAAKNQPGLERQVRLTCRDQFVSTRILARIIPDIKRVLLMDGMETIPDRYAEDEAAPGKLWDPVCGEVEGGQFYSVSVGDMEDGDGGHDS